VSGKEASALICLGEIVGVHGVRGMVKIKVFSDAPENLLDYMPLCDASEKRQFNFLSFQPHKNIYLVTLEGVPDRTAAEKLRGTKLYVPRKKLPKLKEKNTYYHTDLIGLAAKDPDGTLIGRIIMVANYGAGDLLEIQPVKGASYLVPFTTAIVPNVNLEKKEATVVIPPGLLD
jgi:16S rRNA processing protein RimM